MKALLAELICTTAMGFAIGMLLLFAVYLIYLGLLSRQDCS